MEGTWYNPNIDSDDSEDSSEKKSKKDAKEIIKKASLLELFKGDEKKENKKDEDNETEKNHEKDEIGNLDAKEEQIVSEQLVEDHLEQVEAELSQTQEGSEGEAGAISATTFLEKIGDKLDKGEQLDDQVLDEAVAETADALGIPLEEINQEDNEEVEEPSEGIEEPELSDDALEPPDFPTLPVTPTPTTAHGGGIGTPLTPTIAPPAGGSSNFGPQTGTLSIPRTPNVLPISPFGATFEDEQSHSHVPYVLAGGLLGYLLGRRRGRIKTEKKLLPIQKNLEKQVADKNDALIKREETIRRLGMRHHHELNKISREQANEVIRLQKAKRADVLKVYEKGIHKKPEKIGKFALIPDESQPHLIYESLSDKHTIETSRQINFNGFSLESLYKAGRIELKDLKEIVAEYLRGGSYEQLLLKSVKSENSDISEESSNQGNEPRHTSGPIKLADLLPDFYDSNNKDNLNFGRPKETHIATRIALVSAGVVVVIMVAIIITMMLLRGL